MTVFDITTTIPGQKKGLMIAVIAGPFFWVDITAYILVLLSCVFDFFFVYP